MQEKQAGERRVGLGTRMDLAIAGLLLLTIVPAWGQNGNDPMARPAREWAVDAANHEIGVLQISDTYLRYHMHMVDQKGDRVRDVIESKDGSVARVILREGRPLTADEDKDERERLRDILASPANYAKHVKNDAAGKKIAIELIRLVPDAMIYTYTPGQPQNGPGNGEVVLDYHPNPKWSPPSTMAEALTGLEGRIWIDTKTHMMLRMEGNIFKPINFGWGMLAHIYPGGKVSVEQTEAAAGRWSYTHFSEEVSVRAVMVKTLNVRTQIDASGFQVLPGPMSYQEAVKMLLDTPLPGH
jgi:hypothetical protein